MRDDFIEAYDLFLFAQNTGELYPTHLALARGANAPADWISHVERVVIPRYRRDLHTPGAGMMRSEIERAAADLRAYYTEHVAEIARDVAHPA